MTTWWVWWQHIGATTYLIDRFKAKVSFVETCQAIQALVARHLQTSQVLIEDAANGPAVVNTLHRQIRGVIAVRPEGGKFSRAASVQPQIEAGQVFLPRPRVRDRLVRGREWVEDFVDTCAAFPKGAHDDDVDALTQLLVHWNQPKPGAGFLEFARQEIARLTGERSAPTDTGVR